MLLKQRCNHNCKVGRMRGPLQERVGSVEGGFDFLFEMAYLCILNDIFVSRSRDMLAGCRDSTTFTDQAETETSEPAS